MMNQEIVNPAGITRIIYKEIVEGDRRKFEAQSNDAPTGGGARDLRFSPYATFQPIFERLLPNRDINGISSGQLYWRDGEQEKSSQAFFHPPTNARPNEGRLGNVDKCLPTNSLPPSTSGIAILLLIQRDDNRVWAQFTTDQSLESGAWHQSVSSTILDCLHARRWSNVSMVGFVDFDTREDYCNGE